MRQKSVVLLLVITIFSLQFVTPVLSDDVICNPECQPDFICLLNVEGTKGICVKKQDYESTCPSCESNQVTTRFFFSLHFNTNYTLPLICLSLSFVFSLKTLYSNTKQSLSGVQRKGW